jgi:hypothetical protein
MILRFSRQDLPANAVKAVLSIDKTLSAFRPEERLVIAAESVFRGAPGIPARWTE